MSDPEDWENGEWREDQCEHEHATVDILTGELTCSCGYFRYLSGDEIRREAELQAEMMEAYSAEMNDAQHAVAVEDRERSER